MRLYVNGCWAVRALQICTPSWAAMKELFWGSGFFRVTVFLSTPHILLFEAVQQVTYIDAARNCLAVQRKPLHGSLCAPTTNGVWRNRKHATVHRGLATRLVTVSLKLPPSD